MITRTVYYFLVLFFFAFFCPLGYPNNSASAAGTYDLQVSSITSDPVKPVINQEAVITVAIANNGSGQIADVYSRINYEYEIVDMDLTHVSSALDGDGGMTVTIKGKFTKIGSKKIDFEIDCINKVFEVLEDNNTKSQSLTVLADYDLIIESIKTSPANPVAGQDALITVKIKNNGVESLMSYQGLSDYEYVFADFVKTSESYPSVSNAQPLAKSEYFSVVFKGKFTSDGKKSLAFSADVAKQLKEADEENNSKTVTANVMKNEGADLSIESITFSPAEPLANEAVVVSVKISNIGAISLIDSFGLAENDLEYWYSGFSLDSKEHGDFPTLENPLDPDEDFVWKFQGKFIEAGRKIFHVNIEKNQYITESDEANNSAEAEVQVFLTADARDAIRVTNAAIGSISSTSLRILWQTTKGASSFVSCQDELKNWPVIKSSADKATTTHAVSISGFRPDTSYLCRVEAVYGTVKAYSDGLTFRTLANNDFVISPVRETVNSQTGRLSVSWDTNLFSLGTLYYKLSSAKTYLSVAEKILSSSHSLSVAGLKTGQYSYYISSKSDALKKTATTTPKMFAVDIPIASAETPSSPASTAEKVSPASAALAKTAISNLALYQNLKGKIILRAEASGEAYYVNPLKSEKFFLGRPEDAFAVMRANGIGVKISDLEKIPLGLSALTGPDADGDGLPDLFEDAIGSSKTANDSDSDGFADKSEAEGNFSPLKKSAKYPIDAAFAKAQAGKILLQVQGKGEAWFVNPTDQKRYFLGRPADAFAVMRKLGLGVSEANFSQL